MKILYASCRRNFDDVFIVGGKNLYRDESGKDLTEEEFLGQCADKRVLILVHGYRSEVGRPFYKKWYDVVRKHVFRSKTVPPESAAIYGKVLDGINKYGIADHYDVVIGYLWPGGFFKSDYAASVWRADRSAKFLAQLTVLLWEEGVRCMDAQAHSLGAHVALEALRREGGTGWRKLFLLAPAVADESIELGERFGDAVKAETSYTYVFYSKRDKVLECMFPVGETLTGHPDLALGWHGAEDSTKLPPNVKQFDCTRFIATHGGYRTSPESHELWRTALINCGG